MFTTTESDWVKYVRNRYEPPKNIPMPYADEAALVFLLNAPEEYGVESEMLLFAKEHATATMNELCEYFDTLT